MTSSRSAQIHHGLGNPNAWLILLCCSGLLAIWSLPGTIALRHIFLGVGFIASLYHLYREQSTLFHQDAWPIWVLIGFYGWLLMHLAFFNHEWDLQVAELSSLWMRVLLVIPLGLSLGLLLSQSSDRLLLAEPIQKRAPAKLALLLLFLGWMGTFTIFFGRYIYEVYLTHQWLHLNFYWIPFKAKPPFVVASALLLPLCFVLIAYTLESLISKWWLLLSLSGISLSLFGNYFSNTKNGMAIFAICLVFFFMYFLLLLRWSAKKTTYGISIIVAIMLFGAYGISQHIEQNLAWRHLIADIQVGVDAEHQAWWKNNTLGPPPINSLGVAVDGSTYLRTAWFVAGSQLLLENPEGYGLVHHSFGSLAGAKWPDFAKPSGNVRGATHSGWLDFALGVGIPGLLLVLIPLWVSWYRSLFQKGLWFSYASWTIPIMTFAYLITEANEAHFIELLFFMTAFFCGLTLNTPSPPLRRIISKNIKD